MIKPGSPALQVGSLLIEPPGKCFLWCKEQKCIWTKLSVGRHLIIKVLVSQKRWRWRGFILELSGGGWQWPSMLLLLLSCFSCIWLYWPHRWQPTRLLHPWDSPGKNTRVGCHFLLQCVNVKSEREVSQPYLTLSDPMDCSPPGSSVNGIFQARVLEWTAIAFSGSSMKPHLFTLGLVWSPQS